MAAYVGYNLGTELLVEAGNAGTDAWRLILSNTTPNVATNTTAASASELTTGGGYTAGGVVCSLTSSSQTAGLYKLILAAPANPTWTATGGGFTFRYVILYNLTNTQCVAYWDYGSSVVMNGTNGDTFTPTLDAVGGTFTLATPV
jgi:hypothetical protein